MGAMSKHIIVVAGNIGAGKTSLTGRLGEHFGWQTAYESVSDNPYLADFYADMASWSFHLQVFFLGSRSTQYKRITNGDRSAIFDRSIFEDAHIFARALYQLGNMSDRDFAAYQMLYRLTVEQLEPPDLLLYLKASPETLLQRIRGRGRAIEDGITHDYLALLNTLYDEWLSGFDLCPVLTVPADRLDFVAYPHHFDIIAGRIQAKLAGQEEVVFPDNP